MNIIQTNFKYREPLIPLNIADVKYIIIHHPEAVTAAPEQIHQWHLDNGWSGFGYNEYIRKDGTVYIGRGDNVGAHCYGYNAISYGICMEGAYGKEASMPQAQFDSMIQRLIFHKARFPNLIEIGPHGKYYSTDCPGANFPLQEAYRMVESQDNTDTGNTNTGTDVGFNEDQWKLDIIDALHEIGIVDEPDVWKTKVNEPIPVWAAMALAYKTIKYIKG